MREVGGWLGAPGAPLLGTCRVDPAGAAAADVPPVAVEEAPCSCCFCTYRWGTYSGPGPAVVGKVPCAIAWSESAPGPMLKESMDVSPISGIMPGVVPRVSIGTRPEGGSVSPPPPPPPPPPLPPLTPPIPPPPLPVPDAVDVDVDASDAGTSVAGVTTMLSAAYGLLLLPLPTAAAAAEVEEEEEVGTSTVLEGGGPKKSAMLALRGVGAGRLVSLARTSCCCCC